MESQEYQARTENRVKDQENQDPLVPMLNCTIGFCPYHLSAHARHSPEQWDHQDPLARMVPQDCREKAERMVHLDLRDLKAWEDHQVNQDNRDREDQLVNPENFSPEPSLSPDQPDLPEEADLLETPETQDPQDRTATMEIPDQLANLARRALPDHQANKADLERRETTDQREAALTAPQPVWLLDIDLFNFLRFGTSNIPIVERSKNNKEIFRLNQN